MCASQLAATRPLDWVVSLSTLVCSWAAGSTQRSTALIWTRLSVPSRGVAAALQRALGSTWAADPGSTRQEGRLQRNEASRSHPHACARPCGIAAKPDARIFYLPSSSEALSEANAILRQLSAMPAQAASWQQRFRWWCTVVGPHQVGAHARRRYTAIPIVAMMNCRIPPSSCPLSPCCPTSF